MIGRLRELAETAIAGVVVIAILVWGFTHDGNHRSVTLAPERYGWVPDSGPIGAVVAGSETIATAFVLVLLVWAFVDWVRG